MMVHLGLMGSLLLLAGCVTDAPQPLSRAEVQALKIERVNVTVAPDATVIWNAGALAYAEQKGLKRPTANSTDGESGVLSGADSQYLANFDSLTKSEEGKAFTRGRAAQLVKDGVTQALAGQITGKRPARIEIVLKRVIVQNPLLRILVENQDALVADATIVDVATGRSLASFPALTITQQNAGGVVGVILDPAIRGESVPRMAKLYGERLRDWLLPT
jgi:hypothetical protein